MPPEQQNYGDIKQSLDKNSKLLAENNKLLKKIYRNGVWGFWVRVVWYVVLLGLPFALYFYVLQPYFEAFGSNYETFKAGIAEIPGLKGLDQLLDKFNRE